jgi:hypothetical protein
MPRQPTKPTRFIALSKIEDLTAKDAKIAKMVVANRWSAVFGNQLP